MISLSSDNIIFTVAIIAPIISLVGASGTSLHVLLFLTIFWISTCTLCLLFLTKFVRAFRTAPIGESHLTTSVHLTSGFSFVSVLNMPIELLRRYISALEDQLNTARDRLTKLQSTASPFSQKLSIREPPRRNSVTSSSRPPVQQQQQQQLYTPLHQGQSGQIINPPVRHAFAVDTSRRADVTTPLSITSASQLIQLPSPAAFQGESSASHPHMLNPETPPSSASGDTLV